VVRSGGCSVIYYIWALAALTFHSTVTVIHSPQRGLPATMLPWCHCCPGLALNIPIVVCFCMLSILTASSAHPHCGSRLCGSRLEAVRILTVDLGCGSRLEAVRILTVDLGWKLHEPACKVLAAPAAATGSGTAAKTVSGASSPTGVCVRAMWWIAVLKVWSGAYY
jgi:hypothetical protein